MEMKRLGAFLATLAFVAQLQGNATAQQAPDPQRPPSATASRTVEAPTFNVGDSWEYRWPNRPEARSQFKLTVTEIKGDLVTMVSRFGNRFVFTKEGNIVDDGFRKERYDPYISRLQFPLHEGKTWLSYYTLRSDRVTRPLNVTLRAKAGGWERVSVPAGTFDAIRVQIRIEGPATGFDQLCWYAQEVKRFVKCKFSDHVKESDFELVSHQAK